MGDHAGSVSPHWRQAYADAVLELDPTKALERLKEAQAIIIECIEELKRTGDMAAAEPLWNALNTVRDLRRIVGGEL